MLEDLDRLPSDVRARIEQALVNAERALTHAHAQGMQVIPDGYGGFTYPDEHPAVVLAPTVLGVIAVVVEALSEHARTYLWTASRLRSTVEHVVTVTARHLFERFRLQPGRPFDPFRYELMRDALATPWWAVYLQLLEARSVAVIPIGVQLQEQLDNLGWEPDDLADRAKVDTRTVERQIAGTAQPRRENIRQYEAVLSAEKQEDVKFILPPKRPKTPAKRRSKRR